AMLLKLPVIVTAWSGVLDFCDNETAWLCGYQFAKSESHLSAIHSAWADPDVDHLAELLREVHHGDMETRSRRVESAFQRITQNFKWSDVADRTELAVDAIKKQHRLRREPKIGWLSTWNARCGIAAYSSFLTTSIPDSRLIILASHIPERTEKDGANVFRCWDASMDETLEHAFDIAIEREIEVMVIQYNFGFYSLETLALLVQKLKQRNIGVHIFFHSTADIDGERGRISLKTVTDVLKQADRLFVHGIDDLNRLKDMGLVDNLVFFPQGLMPTISNAKNKIDARPLSGKKVLAAYGFLLPHKGIQTLIKAFSILAAQNANWHLLLVTSLYPASVSEHEYHICDGLIHEHGLVERVTFQTEYLTDEESQAWLQQADLIVYPYQKTQESSSAAVRMGLAAGKPVAVTPLSIFDDVQDAVHVLPGTDVDALVSGISCIVNDGSALLAKAQQAELWTQSRQWPVLSHRLINLIDGLANALDLDIGRI
ncbi:MAG: glycosyltransferase, partial [Burkholderiales bacterium]|nr:glycosyltransferase [Burkholderiales bacterium]